MWLVYSWVNATDVPANNTLIVYGFYDAEKMVKKLAEFEKICNMKDIHFKYNVIEQTDDK